MPPVNRRPANQYLHAQTIPTRRECGCNGMHEAPRELSAHSGIGVAFDQVQSKVSRVARGVEAGGCWGLDGDIPWSGEGRGLDEG